MSDTFDQPTSPPHRRTWDLRNWLNRQVARPGFQSVTSKIPGLSRIARKEGEALFDLVAGFVNAQVLSALVELEICETLLEVGRASPEALAHGTGVPTNKMDSLLRAGVALGLLRVNKSGEFSVSQRGAALVGVPGLRAMIRHHGAFYQDLADPVALLRGGQETQLAQVWPYVFGDGGRADPSIKRFYSDLMADSQAMVAADTLRMTSFKGHERLMDVGGGSGAFALAVAKRHRDLRLQVFDLPGVADQAFERFNDAGFANRLTISSGSFRDDTLPVGADVISLIRVLYDHQDETVRDLLSKCHDALPPGGKLVVSEPMTGGQVPSRSGDVYFTFYCMAMQTGQARSAERIAELVSEVGFAQVQIPRAPRPFVTSAVVAIKH